MVACHCSTRVERRYSHCVLREMGCATHFCSIRVVCERAKPECWQMLSAILPVPR